jgi:hypothetical protein
LTGIFLCCAAPQIRSCGLDCRFSRGVLAGNSPNPRNELQTLYICKTDLFQERSVPAFLSQVQDSCCLSCSSCLYPFRPVSPWESGWSPATCHRPPVTTGGVHPPCAPEYWNDHGEPCLTSFSAAVIMGICARIRIIDESHAINPRHPKVISQSCWLYEVSSWGLWRLDNLPDSESNTVPNLCSMK